MDYDTLTRQTPVTLIEFYATWCPHCKRMMPIVEQVRELLEGRAAVVQLDLDQHEALADSIEVTSVPTFIVYRDGVEQWRVSGEIEATTLLSRVEQYL